MSKLANKLTGRRGEEMAAEYLVRKGYKILNRNYRSKWGEIDLIARTGAVVVFVEVKTKTTGDYGEPWEMVNRWKVEQVKRMGEAWCREYRFEGAVRLDVVGVWLSEGRIEHWESVDLS